MNAIKIGNKIVQQNDISWSKRTLGIEALIHINVKIKKQVLRLKENTEIAISKKEFSNIYLISNLYKIIYEL